MKKLSVTMLLLSLILGAAAQAQDAPLRKKKKIKPKNNIILVELFGRAVVYSVNYNRQLNDKFTIGAGFSFYSVTQDSDNVSLLLIPLYVNYYFAEEQKIHRSFVTGGVDLVGGSVSSSRPNSVSNTAAAIIPVIGVGYEYKTDGGFVFRAAPYVFFGGGIRLWAGVAFGVAF